MVLELGLVVGLMALLIGAPMVVAVWPWEYLFGGGWILVVVGLLLGVPTGFWYHVALYRRLAPRGPLPRGWFWHPVNLHERLSPDERAAVLVWFALGGVGFVIAVGGLLLVGVGVVRSSL